MSPYDPLFAGCGLLIAYLVAAAAVHLAPLPFATMSTRHAPAADVDRAAAIDGLRGLLAFGVFIHHGAIWFAYLHTGKWSAPASALYTHLGESSVVLFFMITAFLFGGKIIDFEKKPIRWKRLLVDRLFRLMPLYLVMVAAALAIVVYETRLPPWSSVPHFAGVVARWMSLAIFDLPDIDGFRNSDLVVAKVPWTLRYEVLFYFALPMIAAVGYRLAVPRTVLCCAFAAACCIVGYAAVGGGEPLILSLIVAFAIGIAAAHLVRDRRVRAFARTGVASGLVVALIVAGIRSSPGGLSVRSILVFGLAFVPIAAGTDLFGLLRTRAARFLGEISYGIYLLHGIVLYVVMRAVVGFDAARDLSVVDYWAVVLAGGPVVLVLATVGHVLVERPGIAWGRRMARRSAPLPSSVPQKW